MNTCGRQTWLSLLEYTVYHHSNEKMTFWEVIPLKNCPSSWNDTPSRNYDDDVEEAPLYHGTPYPNPDSLCRPGSDPGLDGVLDSDHWALMEAGNVKPGSADIRIEKDSNDQHIYP